MKELYQLLATELKQVAEIRWIDNDFGQLDNNNIGLKFPAALIKLNSGNKDIDESGSQEKKWTVQIRLAFDGLGSRTSADTPDSVLARSLAWADVADRVYNLLQGAEVGEYNAFECTSEGQETRSDGLVVYRYVFTTDIMVFK